MTFSLLSSTCWRHCSSKVLKVQVVHKDLLQFVHFRYCWSSPSPCSNLVTRGFLVVLQGVLLVCSQLLLSSAVQIHAKLSVCQACSRRAEESLYCAMFLILKISVKLTNALAVFRSDISFQFGKMWVKCCFEKKRNTNELLTMNISLSFGLFWNVCKWWAWVK